MPAFGNRGHSLAILASGLHGPRSHTRMPRVLLHILGNIRLGESITLIGLGLKAKERFILLQLPEMGGNWQKTCSLAA